MISTADLQDWMKADDADAPVLRSLEEAAIKAIEKLTGRYLGVTAAVTEVIRFRGFPLTLANTPIGGVLTSLDQWDGTAWALVDTTSYYVLESFIFNEGSWNPLSLTKFRAIYQAGYTVDALDADVWPAPADIQMAVKLLVGTWFEHRESVVVGTSGFEVPQSVQMLVAAHARVAV